MSLFVELSYAQVRNNLKRRFDPFPDDLTEEDIRRLKIAIRNYTYGRTVMSVINIGLLIYLLSNYVEIYKISKSNFAFGLVVLSIALLLYSISSNPYVTMILSFDKFKTPRVFTFIPDIFTTVASIILIYLSRQ